MTPLHIALAAAIGLAAGIIGGLAGVGGSLVMLPGLALVFGYRDAAHSDQHLFMAAAMAVNVLVATPATIRHTRAGAVRRDLVVRIIPPMAAAIIVGVLISDRVRGGVLKQMLAVFIAGYCVVNIYRMLHPRAQENRPPERTGAALVGGIGATAGLFAGLLGIGGGGLLVPALNAFARVRLLHAIGTSSAAMVVTAAIGSALKFGTLQEHGLSRREALMLALAMAPGAILGGWCGAWLAHRLPLKTVRLAISIILLAIAVRLAIPAS